METLAFLSSAYFLALRSSFLIHKAQYLQVSLPTPANFCVFLYLVPEQVQRLSSTTETTTTITLQWNEVEGTVTTTYSLIWTFDNGTGSVSGVSGTSTMINNLISNTMYSFQIKAVNDGGEGELSANHTAFTSTFIGRKQYHIVSFSVFCNNDKENT